MNKYFFHILSLQVNHFFLIFISFPPISTPTLFVNYNYPNF